MTETTKPDPISEALLDSWITWYAGEHDSPFSNSVASALRELKALRQENEWIKVTPETMPPAWKNVGAIVRGDFSDPITGFFASPSNKFAWGAGRSVIQSEMSEITHYCELKFPAPPAPRTEEQ